MIKKKLILFITGILLLTGCMRASQPSNEEYAGFEFAQLEDGTLELQAYTLQEKKVVIPSQVDGKTVTVIGEGAFSGNAFVEKIVVPEGVVRIEDYAFEANSSLRKVYLPETLISIGNGAFSGCTHLQLVDIQDGLETIGDGAFLFCKALDSFHPSASLSEAGSFAFAGCESLRAVDLTHTSLKCIRSRMFWRCDKLSSFRFPLELERIEDSAFSGCVCLDELTFPDTLLEIGAYAFDSCSKLTYVYIPAETIGDHAFTGCYELNSVFFSERLSYIGTEAFCGFELDLTYSDIPEDAAIEPNAFSTEAEEGEEEAVQTKEKITPEGVDVIEADALIAQAEQEGYHHITNDEFETWAQEYRAYNEKTAVMSSEYNPYIDMYKGEVVPYFTGMISCLSNDPSTIPAAEGIFGINFEPMFLMMDHGLRSEISRFILNGDLLLFSGVFDSQLMVAAGTEEVPTFEQLKDRVGCTFTDPIMISTTTDLQVSLGFSDTVFIIYAPAESVNRLGSVCMDAYSHTSEKEILMNPGAQYEILDVGFMSSTAQDDEGKAVTSVDQYVLVKLLN